MMFPMFIHGAYALMKSGFNLKIIKFISAGLLVIGVSFLAGCDTTETTMGHGQIQTTNGKGSQSVQLKITQDTFDDSGAEAMVALGNGEVFKGKIIIEREHMESTTDSSDYFSWDSDDDKKKKEKHYPETTNTNSTSYSSQARGVLFSASRSMQCLMTLSDPRSGFSNGGVGRCTISTGEVVPVQF